MVVKIVVFVPAERVMLVIRRRAVESLIGLMFLVPGCTLG